MEKNEGRKWIFSNEQGTWKRKKEEKSVVVKINEQVIREKRGKVDPEITRTCEKDCKRFPNLISQFFHLFQRFV